MGTWRDRQRLARHARVRAKEDQVHSKARRAITRALMVAIAIVPVITIIGDYGRRW